MFGIKTGITATTLSFLLQAILVFQAFSIPADAAEDTGKTKKEKEEQVVYIIPIKDNIEGALLYVIRRGIQQARSAKADAIVFVMDTNGGELQAADEIVKMLLKVEVPTYTFVDTKAYSAGAIIAIATDHIYMAPGSVIGAATPILISPFGGVQEMPEAVQEKMSSAVSALIRSAAQAKKHDPELAEAMIRKDMEYKVGDEVISRKDELLTLTSYEAQRMVGEGKERHHLLSEGIVTDLDQLLEQIKLENARRIHLEVSPVERIARVIKAISVLLLAGGLLGIYIEIKTPGFGIPGVLGIICLLIFFWGHHIAGLAGAEEILLFIVGVVLLLIEVFVTPGFGVMGILGIALMIVGLFASMLPQIPDLSSDSMKSLDMFAPLRILSMAVIIAGLAATVAAKLLPHGSHLAGLVLLNSTDRKHGYSSRSDAVGFVGREGKTISDLRPGGTGMFGEDRVDIVSQGELIPKDTMVKVIDVKDGSIIVAALRNSQEHDLVKGS